MTDTPKREPLLTRSVTSEWAAIRGQELHSNHEEYIAFMDGIKQTIDHYENLIDAGVLMVVKTVKCIPHEGSESCCSNCYAWIGGGPNFCSDCGSKIIE